MAGIYIHIPFCRKACFYCNFHFSTSLQAKSSLIKAILEEIPLRTDYLGQEKISTLYFGGGTPSILDTAEINEILKVIKENFDVKDTAEITLEANPDDLTNNKPEQLKNIGINRLSIGVQAFLDPDLQWMNRSHSASQALQSIKAVKEAGFANFSIDLIYGTPLLSEEKWQQNILQAIDLQVPHLSCYALTVEPSTALDNFIRQKKYPPVDADKAARQFELLMDWLEKAGYEQYEISNFALPGYRSKHNSSYWEEKHYLGIGPSAHSYNGISRQWNIANNALYIQSIQQGKIPAEKESLTPTMQLNEYIMTSLRTSRGCDLILFEKKFGRIKKEKLIAESMKYLQQGKLFLKNNHLILSKQGKLFADGIAADLFF
jgi:putative oxygen-independent coproporphyrinogen III oxidase